MSAIVILTTHKLGLIIVLAKRVSSASPGRSLNEQPSLFDEEEEKTKAS